RPTILYALLSPSPR
nr:Chain B, Nuclear receptor 0B2 [synthetic construct]